MKVPFLNPLRFYKPNGSKTKDLLSFKEASNYWNSLDGNYTPLFKDKLQSIVYEDKISGDYGYTSLDQWLGTPTFEEIQGCKYYFEGRAIQSNLDGANVRKLLVIKYEGEIDIEIRDNTTIIDTFSGENSGYFTYTLGTSFVNLNVAIDTIGALITSVMLIEPYINYDVCDDTIRSFPIDTCNEGGVYLINLTQSYFRQTIDFLPIAVAFSSGSIDIDVTYDNGTILSGSVDNSATLTQKIQSALDLLTAINSYIVVNDAIIRDALIHKISYSQGVTIVNLVPSDIEEFNTSCCKIIIGDYESEYFNIINQEDKETLKLLEFTYSSTFMDKGCAFSDKWSASLLLNGRLSFTNGNDVEIFDGQTSNKVLKADAKILRTLKTGAIPDYLCEKLTLILGLDLVSIDNQIFTITENANIQELEDLTDLFQLEATIRKEDFEFTDGDGSEIGLFCKPAKYVVKYENETIIQQGDVSSGGSLLVVVPNPGDCEPSTFEINGVEVGTAASGGSLEILVKQDGSQVGSLISGEWIIPSPTPMQGAMPLKTGQTTSYQTGDDAFLQKGRLTNFTTLDFNNVFGNTTRFTDELGGQTYTNKIVIDHATKVCDSNEHLAFYFGDAATTRTHAQAVTWGLGVSVGIYTSGWFLSNINQLLFICNFGVATGWMNYAPFFQNLGLWSSSRYSTGAIILIPQTQNVTTQPIGNSYRTFACRIMTWNGTSFI